MASLPQFHLCRKSVKSVVLWGSGLRSRVGYSAANRENFHPSSLLRQTVLQNDEWIIRTPVRDGSASNLVNRLPCDHLT